jgi:hypothetical protein
MGQLSKDFLDLQVRDLIKLVLRPTQVAPYFFRKADRHEFVRFLTGLETSHLLPELEKGLMQNEKFYAEINKKLIAGKAKRMEATFWYSILYLLVRVLKPRQVVETGVFDGLSSAFILQGLEDNAQGELISIDLPAVSPITHSIKGDCLPPGCDPGWVVPDYLRSRYRLVLDDSKRVLQSILDECGEIGLFVHDSLHTFEHMYFEYRTAWPYLVEGGVLLSDDIFAWGSKGAFFRFAKEEGRVYRTHGGYGGIKK